MKFELADRIRLLLKGQDDDLADGVRESLEYARSSTDPKENEETRPPEEERIVVLCFWAVEVFPPSQYQTLLQGMRELGWDESEPGPNRKSPLEWVREVRSGPYGSAWRNVGKLTRDGAGTMTRAAPLPSGIDYAFVHLQQVLPSHTAVALQFVLKDNFASKLDKVLNTDFEAEAHGDGVILGAGNLKQKAAKRARGAIRNKAFGWFEEYLPGRFANGALDGVMPSCEFLLVREARPFWDNNRYLHVLGLEHPFRAWESKQLAGLRFSRLGPGRRLRHYWSLAGREDELWPDEDMETWGGRNRDGYVNRVGNFSRWFAVRSLESLVTSYERPIARLRDRISSEVDDRASDTTYLRQEIADWSSLQRDAVAFLSEFQRKAQSTVRFIGAANTVAFQQVDFPEDEDRSAGSGRTSVDVDKEGQHYEALEGLRHDLRERTTRLDKVLSRLGEILVARSNLDAAWASTRLQETAIVLAVLVAAAGIVAVFQSQFSGPVELGLGLVAVASVLFLGIKGLDKMRKCFRRHT